MMLRPFVSILACVSFAALSCGPTPPAGNQIPDDNGTNDGTDAGSVIVVAEPVAFTPDDSLIPTPALGGSPLLNEVRSQPSEGDVQFIELKGATVVDLAAGLVLRNENSDTFSIPASTAPADANGIITVYFDGQDQTSGDAVHAAPTSFLSIESGHVTLETAGGTELDRVQWGMDPHESVVERGTGAIRDALPGQSLARRPYGTTPSAVGEWFVAYGQFITPGLPNRNHGVQGGFPGDGALVQVGDVRVDGVPVLGAAQFEVQVAADPEFAGLVIDRWVEDGPVMLDLPIGGYYWRVQATLADGSRSDFSPIQRLIVLSEIPEGELPDDESTAKAIGTEKPAAARKALSHPVPMYFQHKDSAADRRRSVPRTPLSAGRYHHPVPQRWRELVRRDHNGPPIHQGTHLHREWEGGLQVLGGSRLTVPTGSGLT